MEIKMIDSNKTCFIFDVDGTLSEPRQEVKQEHKKIFINWAKNKQCFISTGSDFVKVKQQIEQNMLDCFKSIYCCMGNETRNSKGFITRQNHFIVPDDLNLDLENFIRHSLFEYRTGRHFEVRTGMVNFSVVGRNATPQQRKEYYEWDQNVGERIKMASFINDMYPDLEASVGGSISIDIIKKGCDKGQVVHHLQGSGAEKIVFVGDRCFPGGNDYGIIRELKNTTLEFEWYNVSSPNETYNLIKKNEIFRG
jgi:phosphomannomutase